MKDPRCGDAFKPFPLANVHAAAERAEDEAGQLRGQLADERESHAKTAKQFVDMKAYADAKEQQLAVANKLVCLLRDEYWAQTPFDVAKLADEFLTLYDRPIPTDRATDQGTDATA